MSLTSLLLQLGVSLLGLVVAYAYLLRLERRALGGIGAGIATRRGPLWPLLDALQSLTRRAAMPAVSHRLAYLLGPWLALLATLGAIGLLALSAVMVRGEAPTWQLAAPYRNLALVLLLPWISLLGTLLRGWGDGRPYVRGETQALVQQGFWYSVPTLLAVAGTLLLAGSLDIGQLVARQGAQLPYLVYQPLGGFLFATSLLLAGRRLPYRLPGCRNRLLSDFQLQHASGALALCHWTEYLHLFLTGMMFAVLYLAGGHGLWWDGLHWLLLKALLVAVALLLLRDCWLEELQRRAGKRLWRIWALLALGNLLLAGVLLAWRQGL